MLTGEKRVLVDYYALPFQEQVKWDLDLPPFMPNWKDFQSENDFCKRLLMDKHFYRDWAIIE